MTVLDGAIANVALPTLSRELHVTEASTIWIVNAYQLAVVVALLPFAALGDRLGYRRIYTGGLVLFTVGSLACALSHSLGALVLSRLFQGLGAAGVMSCNVAVIRLTYPRRLLGHGIGLNAMVVSISSAIGPTVASAILGVARWEWLFAVNVPIGIFAIFLAMRSLPDSARSEEPFDIGSALLSAMALGLLILGADSMARASLLSGSLMMAVAVASGAVLVWRELRVTAPMVPLDLLRVPLFALSIGTSILSFGAQALAFVALPFLLQGFLARGVVATGLLMTPWPLAVALAAPLAGRLSDRYAAGVLGGIGLSLMAVGLFTLFLTPEHASNLRIILPMILSGLGFGFFQSPNNRAMVSVTPLARSGAVGGMQSTARLLGQTAGALLMAVLFHLMGVRAPTPALAIAAGMAGCGALLSLTRLSVMSGPSRLTGAPQA